MRCNIISDDNGVGLTQDSYLLRQYLHKRGHVTKFFNWDGDSLNNADVNFYLEKFAPRHLKTARRHVMVPNLEWTDAIMVSEWMPRMDQIWAKSTYCYQWLMDRGATNARYSGWLSRDMATASRANRWGTRTALHVAGKSQAKGTTAILQAYWTAAGNHIDLPPLTVVSHVRIDPVPPKVFQCNGGWSNQGLRHLMNQAAFHLCPSEVEGWGHYIVEGLSAGGVVVTTDSPPMSDHVAETYGVLLEPKRVIDDCFVARVFVDPDQIVEALMELGKLSDDELTRMSHLARVRYEQICNDFEARADELMAQLAAG